MRDFTLKKIWQKKDREGFGEVGFCFFIGENTDLINKVFGMR